MKQKLLYYYPASTTFVRTDEELFRKDFLIKSFCFASKRKIFTPWIFFKQLIFIVQNIWNSDVTVCHFAGYHSFLPALINRLVKKPTIIILAGTDCVAFPSIKYGNFTKRLLGMFTKWSLQLCNHTCPVHTSLVFTNYSYTTSDYPHQGYKYFCKKGQSRFTEIPYGFDTNSLYSKNEVRLPNSFLTVTQTVRGTSFFRKGIDLVIECAKLFPAYNFAIVGFDDELRNQYVPKNVRLVQPLPFHELVNVYNRYEFYFQLSICEGFPNALCESMLCGCIPIGSDVAAIPDIIHNSGFILKHKNIDELFEIITKATSCNKTEYSLIAQNRIKDNFSLEKRRLSLNNVIKSLVPD